MGSLLFLSTLPSSVKKSERTTGPLAANTLKWSESDLHVLYQKRLDPKLKNYTALVWWQVKVANKKGSCD